MKLSATKVIVLLVAVVMMYDSVAAAGQRNMLMLTAPPTGIGAITGALNTFVYNAGAMFNSGVASLTAGASGMLAPVLGVCF